MSQLSDAFEIIDSHPDLADFEGPPDDGLLDEAETALGQPIVGDYRAFVSRYGAGNFGSQEIYGIFTREFLPPGPPEAVGITLDAREHGLPAGMIVIYDGGDGTQLALDERDTGQDPPVTRIALGMSPDAWEPAYGGFGEFLLDVVTREVEDR